MSTSWQWASKNPDAAARRIRELEAELAKAYACIRALRNSGTLMYRCKTTPMRESLHWAEELEFHADTIRKAGEAHV